jgi:hypothetical protein
MSVRLKYGKVLESLFAFREPNGITSRHKALSIRMLPWALKPQALTYAPLPLIVNTNCFAAISSIRYIFAESGDAPWFARSNRMRETALPGH